MAVSAELASKKRTLLAQFWGYSLVLLFIGVAGSYFYIFRGISLKYRTW